MTQAQHIQNIVEVITICFGINPKHNMKGLIDDLMTPQEIVELSTRIEIIKKLKGGMTQRGVAQELDISVTTVNRGARVLKFGKGAAAEVIYPKNREGKK